MNTSVRNERSPGQRSGLGVVWTIFVVTICGLGLIAFTKPSTIKQPDAVAQAHQASMKEQLLTTTPGDLAVINGGQIVVLGLSWGYVVHADVVHYTDIHAVQQRTEKHLVTFSSMTERVVKKDDPSYGMITSCLLQGKMVVAVDYRYTCR